MKRYPFTFVQADALDYPLDDFDFIWASPPCQGYSVMRHLPWNRERKYPLLIQPIWERLESNGAPYIIENVMGARREKAMANAPYLCGTMFGKRFYRHRLFASNFAWLAPLHPTHFATIRSGRNLAGRAREMVWGSFKERGQGHVTRPENMGGIDAWCRSAEGNGLVLGMVHQPGAAHARQEMGVEWMSADGCGQAVPPAYSKYLAQFIPLTNGSNANAPLAAEPDGASEKGGEHG